MIETIRWEKSHLILLDQRKLPHKVSWFKCKSYMDAIHAIKSMVVRGAPLIGLVGAYGLLLGAKGLKIKRPDVFLGRLKKIKEHILEARPTAVNLRWALDSLWSVVEGQINKGVEICINEMESFANFLVEEDKNTNMLLGKNGAEIISDGDTILTHCNAGALATGGFGTALGVIATAHEQGKKIKVLVDETRPWLQGHRLTAWELKELGIEHYVIADAAAGHFMAKGMVDLVITGADRIAANGDTANKIGTYSLAVCAKENKIPFYIAAPISTIDRHTPTGNEIPVEERPQEEVLFIGGRRIGPKGTKALNPVFDVTPGELIAGIITEKGVIKAPYKDSIHALFGFKA